MKCVEFIFLNVFLLNVLFVISNFSGFFYLKVIDESTISQVPAQVAASTTHIVKAEWFWASVQNEGCVDEKDYLFEDVSIILYLY